MSDTAECTAQRLPWGEITEVCNWASGALVGIVLSSAVTVEIGRALRDAGASWPAVLAGPILAWMIAFHYGATMMREKQMTVKFAVVALVYGGIALYLGVLRA
ncbi:MULTISPECIES: hypothetical protein [Halobacterium]|uniref:hypothetical protein n=1 Tax=Halobacterium TaxID=2239 RepID=UPI00073F1194|nr:MULTISPECIES: hypothetical protein [Halobacterium]MCG1002844.1 hypothetical protein [Halobacterium noricense]